MSTDPDIAAIEQRAAAVEGKLPAVLKRAGVAATTWARWKAGAYEPRRATLRKLHGAIDDLAKPARSGRARSGAAA